MVRLRRVVQRVLKGLFYHVKGYRIPDGYEALVLTDDNIEKWPKELVNPVMSNRAVTLGNRVFSYKPLFIKTTTMFQVGCLSFTSEQVFSG